jgi:prevent-host-death family protein
MNNLVMMQVNLYEAKTRLSELIREAMAGEEVVIARHGKPVARLIPYRRSESVSPGFLKGKVRWSDDFDAPLDDLADYS